MRGSIKKELARCCTASLGKVLKYGAVIFATGVVIGVVVNSVVVVKLSKRNKSQTDNKINNNDATYGEDDFVDAECREVGDDDAI